MKNIHVRENMDWLPLAHALTGDQIHNPGMCPDWELNLQHFGLWDGAHPTEPHQPGLIFIISNPIPSVCYSPFPLNPSDLGK